MAHPVVNPYAARRRRWTRVLPIGILALLLLELIVIIVVGKWIGAGPTVLLLLLETLVGIWLVRREGAKTWRALQSALGTGKMPSRELADAALILVGGALLILPGFLSDLVGLFVILPFTRPLTRRFLETAVAARLLAGGAFTTFPGGPSGPGFPPDAGSAPGPGFPPGAGFPADQAPPAAPGRGQTIEGEIIDPKDR